MAIGRISGPLLQRNLFRDDVPLAFYNTSSSESPVLYLDVSTGRVGIRTDAPAYALDVAGFINADNLRVVETNTGTGVSTLGRLVLYSGTITTTVGPIDIAPSGNNDINLRSNVTVFGDLHSTGNITADGNIQFGNTTTDVVIFEAEVKSNLIPAQDNTYNIGNETHRWAEAYFEKLYTNYIASNTGTIKINPGSGLTEIAGDIRATGKNPIGTFPVVTNILYVTADGSDTNDGRGMDASRACRTISGALKSPFYTPGTSIKVAPGHYLENNPLVLLPYTSIIGSDIRTTFVEPINKTQDLFHLQSGCYLAQMQFRNGRSGLLPIENRVGFNRGAYCTAFLPLSENGKIDVYHSPYVQNCTNQSGPWLKDGTLFLPNQTIQVPAAVGTGTWAVGTTTIVVSVRDGDVITIGDAINEGPQNTGFFDARTLMLANKEFLKEQVVAYVNDTFPGFEYSQSKCARDVGIIVENVAYDVAFGGNQKSVESGLAYYDGVVSLIDGQETQTIAAINYLNSLTQQVIVNSTVTNLYTGTNQQVINFVLTGGGIASTAYTNCYDIITNIISSGTSVAPEIVISSGPDYQLVSAEVLLQSNRSFIQEDVINYIDNTYSGLVYDQAKCFRDVGLIVESLARDLLFTTSSQSVFAGIQYWNQGSTVIPGETTATVQTFTYVRDIVSEVVQNITTGTRYSTSTQNTSLPAATQEEADRLAYLINTINDIIENGVSGVSDRIEWGRLTQDLQIDVRQAYAVLQANRSYIQDEAIAYIDANLSPGSIPGYDESTCRRDVGYILDSISFDLLYGGNKQSIQSGVAYYGYTGTSAIPGETTATIAAYNFIKNLVDPVIQGNNVTTTYQTTVTQIVNMISGTASERNFVDANIDIITGIISSGTVGVSILPMSLTASTSTNVINGANILLANKKFIQAETVAYINEFFAFDYNRSKCRRDVGLLIDAVTQDIILNGTAKSIEAGLSYFIGTQSVIRGQITQTVDAINRIKYLATASIITNTTATVSPGNTATQQILPFYQGGISAKESIERNFDIITNIIENGPAVSPNRYTGTSLFPKSGVSQNDVRLPSTVTSITTVSTNVYSVTLSTSTYGSGYNATLYFGPTRVFPLQDKDVPSEWQQRQVDPIGAMGGSLVDGDVVSERSPINSFVYDAFTQVSQGGRGIHITNNGYAQLVSVFTIFCSTAVQVDNGGIASITNSNSNFGDICLLAKGYGKLSFSGTVYNPPFQADPYDENPDPEQNINQFYPEGFYPNNAQVKIFVPDDIYRPHIGLIMEVEPPSGYINDQGFEGFLTTQATVSTLTTGSLTINNIDTTGIAIGNTVFVRDFEASDIDSTGTRYIATGTTVVDVGYQTVTLSQALTSGGGDPTIDNSFDLYFCGNAYYTVLSSTTSTTTSSNATTFGTRLLPSDQVGPELDFLDFLESLLIDVVSNTVTPISTASYVYNNQNIGGSGEVESTITNRISIIKEIFSNGSTSTYVTVNALGQWRPKPNITKSGTIPQGSAAAISLISNNYDFIAAESLAYIDTTYPSLVYNKDKCARDAKLIARQIVYDIQSGGNYFSYLSGISYWARSSTYHIVDLEDQVRDPVLFPDGAIVNFYQRSYMSALGYTFEYVGAGITYGALPQVGIADPVQSKEVIQLDNGKVFFTSTDQNGDFRIGPELVISQATGTLRGRTFTRSLFAEMTPFILAVETGA